METMLRDRRAVLAFVGPALLVYSLIVLVPIVWSLVYTVFEGNVIAGFQFVGFHNYTSLFSDPTFWQALLFTVEVLGRRDRGPGGGRPAAVAVVRLLSWQGVPADPDAGVLPGGPAYCGRRGVVQEDFRDRTAVWPGELRPSAVHLDGLIQPWLGQGGSAFWVIAIMDIWRSMGFYGVLLFAGLVDIPGEIIESARIDGASGWRLVRYIVLPLLAPILFSSFIFSINGTLKVFDTVLALTGGGPGQATTPLTLDMFNTAFANGQYGYGSTIATALAIMCLRNLGDLQVRTQDVA